MVEGKSNQGTRLTYWICAAIVLAIVLAVVAPGLAQSFEVGGEIFLRLLKMIVVPLVFTSVLSGVLGLGDVRKLGRPGAAAIGYYLCTTMLAVILGIALVNLIRPGEGAVDRAVLDQYSQLTLGSPREEIIHALSEQTGLSREQVNEVMGDLPSGTAESPSVGMILENLLLMLVTDNLFASAMETQLLPIIVFAILFGAMLTTMGREVTTLRELIEQANAALMRFVMWLMTIAPIGIFCLVAARFGEAAADERFLAELAQIGWYVATVLTGLFVHALFVLPMIFWWVRRENPYRFLMKMSKAVLTAFSTASSSATLPLTMECAEEAGVSRDSTEFVIPLGATINMDGTALYEAVAAIFIAQAIGFDLSLADQAVIALTATLAAIGAAGIPEAGLVTMLIVLNAVGLPVEYVGLILAVDWLLDRFRTAVNILGDSVGAAVVEKAMPSIDTGEV